MNVSRWPQPGSAAKRAPGIRSAVTRRSAKPGVAVASQNKRRHPHAPQLLQDPAPVEHGGVAGGDRPRVGGQDHRPQPFGQRPGGLQVGDDTGHTVLTDGPHLRLDRGGICGDGLRAGRSDNERAQPAGMADGEDEADPAAEGLPPDAGAVHAKLVQDGEHIGRQVMGAVHGGVVRLAAAAAAVDQHDPEPAGERVHVAGVPPGGRVPDEPVQQDERRPAAGQLVVDRRAGGVDDWHAGMVPPAGAVRQRRASRTTLSSNQDELRLPPEAARDEGSPKIADAPINQTREAHHPARPHHRGGPCLRGAALDALERWEGFVPLAGPCWPLMVDRRQYPRGAWDDAGACLPSAANHTDVFANRLNVVEQTEGEGTVMRRRAFVGACLTLVLLVAVGMPAVASPAAPAARKPKVTTIPVGLGPVRVATNPQTNTIYVTNNGDGTVSVINGKKNRVVATIPVGVMPVGVATNPQTNTAYAVDSHTRTMSVIDGATNTVTATVSLGFHPDQVATNPQTNTVYVIDSAAQTVSVIDGATNTVTATIPLGISPAFVATNPQTNTIYVTDVSSVGTGTLWVIDGQTNTVTATVSFADNSFGALPVATNPQTNTIYVTHTNSDFSGTLSVISGATNSVTATVTVGQFPGGVATNPQTNTVYVANTGSGSVSVVRA